MKLNYYYFLSLLSPIVAFLFLVNGCGGRPASHPRAKEKTAVPEEVEKPKTIMRVYTPAFAAGERIPRRYTGDGEDVPPQIHWDGIPEGTKSFALICSDPDAPLGTFIHWVVYNIPKTARSLPEALPPKGQLEDGTRQGVNSFQRIGYNGPKPPPGKSHRYFFRVYALDDTINLAPGASAGKLQEAMAGHILAEGELMGIYGR